MNSLTYKIDRLFTYIILAVAAVILGLLSVCSLIWQPAVYQDARERMHFDRNSVLFFLLAVVLAILLFRFRRKAAELSQKKLFLVLSAIYIAAAIYLIFGVDSLQRGDPGMVLQYALAFNKGDYSGLLPGKYVNIYPIQLGFITYERILAVISENPRLFFFVNLGIVLVINYLTWQITDLLSDNNQTADNLAILFSFAFLPQYFYILWLYGQIPGLCFTMLSYWFLIRGIRNGRVSSWIGMCICMSVSCLLKPNYKIAAIAAAIVCLLELLKNSRKKLLLVILLLIVSVAGSEKLLNACYRQASGIHFGEGSPMILHITMGLQDNTLGRTGGWYNGYTFDTYVNSGNDSAKAALIGKRDLDQRLQYFRTHPAYTVRFFGKKIVSTWCDPTFQSIWCGPLEDCGQYTHTFILQSIYTAGVAYVILKLFMHAVALFLFLLTAAYPFLRRKTVLKMSEPAALFPLLYLIGGFLFHLVSETKSEYVYMYVFLLIPLASMSLTMLNVNAVKEKMSIGKRR